MPILSTVVTVSAFAKSSKMRQKAYYNMNTLEIIKIIKFPSSIKITLLNEDFSA